MGASKSTLSS
jgi:hypothetical protein